MNQMGSGSTKQSGNQQVEPESEKRQEPKIENSPLQNPSTSNNENPLVSVGRREHGEVVTGMSLEEYSKNFPLLRETFKAILEIIQAVQGVKESDLSNSEVLSGLDNEAICLLQFTQTQPSKLHILADFVVDHQGPEALHKITEQLYTSYLTTADTGKAIVAIKGHATVNSKNDNVADAAVTALEWFLSCIQNFADTHDAFCLACGKTGMIPLYVEMCEEIVADGTDADTGKVTLSKKELRILEVALSVVYNLSRRPGNKVHFRGCNAVVTLLRFSKLAKSSAGFAIPAVALLTLAYLIDEESNRLIMTDGSLIQFLISLLNKAIKSPERRFFGYSTVELADGLSHIAVNDSNKRVLGEKGAIQALVAMIKDSKDEREKVHAANALWTLAFDEANKELIKQKGGLDVLRSLQQSQNPDLQQAATGALWEISGKQERRASSRADETHDHVMISYQWDVQKRVVELKNQLQAAGYKVWIDLDDMCGSTLEAMARAVENACAVLVCVSHKYKESPNCRSEAEYAYQQRKTVIPLMMEENFKPDGWLGIIVGTKLWFDFRGHEIAHASIEKLKKELGNRGKRANVNESLVVHKHTDEVDSVPPVPKHTTTAESTVSGWTAEDVQNWLTKIGLLDTCQQAIPQLSGQILMSLHELRQECPEYFYKSLERDLNLQNVFNVFKFRDELSKLLTS